jgi:hypothetical protein
MLIKKSVLSGSLVLVLLCLEFPQGARSQTYYYSGGSASQWLAYSDGANISGGTDRWLDLGPFNETFYLDPVANTLQVVGSISINNPTENYQPFPDWFYINGTWVPGTVTVNDTAGNGGSVAFDSGVENFNFSDNYSVQNPGFFSFNLNIPITGNYSLDTGGQTYDGTFSYTLSLDIRRTIS